MGIKRTEKVVVLHFNADISRNLITVPCISCELQNMIVVDDFFASLAIGNVEIV